MLYLFIAISLWYFLSYSTDYYEPTRRWGHSTEIIGTKVYLWGGRQDNLPRDHDSVEKRLLLSVVDIFNIETGKKSLLFIIVL